MSHNPTLKPTVDKEQDKESDSNIHLTRRTEASDGVRLINITGQRDKETDTQTDSKDTENERGGGYASHRRRFLLRDRQAELSSKRMRRTLRAGENYPEMYNFRNNFDETEPKSNDRAPSPHRNPSPPLVYSHVTL